MSREALRQHPAPVHELDAVESTNTLARQALERGAVDGELFIAAEQTAGRGRLGRTWHSPAGRGNLYLSLILRRETLPLSHVSQLTLAAGVAMAEALHGVYGLEPSLKWPNDLLVGRRKLGGILCEGVLSGEALCGVVIGVGVNLRGEPEALPAPLDTIATTVEHELGSEARIDEGSDRDRFALAARFVHELEALLAHGDGDLDAMLAEVRRRWRARANLPARVALDDGRSGRADALDAQGRLLVTLDEPGDAPTVAVESGEVTWL